MLAISWPGGTLFASVERLEVVEPRLWRAIAVRTQNETMRRRRSFERWWNVHYGDWQAMHLRRHLTIPSVIQNGSVGPEKASSVPRC